MESMFKEQLHHMAEKLENYLFPDAALQNEDQTAYFQSFFTDSYVFPSNLLKYFRQEIGLGFFFNIVLFGIFVLYLPFNYEYCWECNSVMTLWLSFLCLLNAALIVPKVLLVRKLFKIEDMVDIYIANYNLWMFFRSRVYKFNIMMSKYVFSTYVVGSLLLIISWASEETCDRFYGLIGLLLGSFVVRVVSSFFKFIRSFNNAQNAESLIEYFNGTNTTEIQSLRVMSHTNYSAFCGRQDETCPICFENYEGNDEVRIMECPGDHGFHKKCIDKWLLKSNKCPKCNLSVFYQREQKAKKE